MWWQGLIEIQSLPQRKLGISKFCCLKPSGMLWNSEHLEADEEKAMAPHSSTLAWKILWMEEPGRLQSMGSLGSDTIERLHFHF